MLNLTIPSDTSRENTYHSLTWQFNDLEWLQGKGKRGKKGKESWGSMAYSISIKRTKKNLHKILN